MPEQLVAQYLYGVIHDRDDLGQVPPGIHGREVEVVAHDGLAAVVSGVDDGAPLGRRRDLTAHHEVLRHLAMAVDVAPMQFGLVLPDRDAVRDEVLERHHDTMLSVLDRVAGSVQLSARATYDEPTILQEIVRTNRDVARLRERTRGLPPGQPHPDLLRLGELVTHALEAKRREDSDLLLSRLQPLVVLFRERDEGAPHQVLDVALLVERDRVAELEDQLEILAESLHPRIQLRLTTPTAPFDFVEERLWA